MASVAEKLLLMGKGPFTAKSYVQDGLVFQVDAIENISYGKHEAGSRFFDLVSGKKVIDSSACSVEDDVIVMSGNNIGAFDSPAVTNALKSGKFTCEVHKDFDAKLSQATGYLYEHNAGFTYAQVSNYYSRVNVNCGLVLKIVKPVQISDGDFLLKQLACNRTNAIGRAFSKDGKIADVQFTDEDNMDFSLCNRIVGIYFYGCKLKSLRWYDRCLSESELDYNMTIDKVRFEI